ncbi:hypothetical protein FOA43_001071 [Brettanomyces nanus]|uniref:Uncharacterized protein n=1 Tax=Eeniella nana TaxID=13502 RepID=A0A875RTQ7_EENNA|nr:uncharacterized protein FOA43_001071 [Brettanomyces nanus]QPG73757.1 hypothetical protein FOA43_001071 [Brettanomyces nanus]
MSDDTSEIHRAVIEGKMMTLKALLAEDPKLALLKDQDSRTPLHWACSFQRTDMVTVLLNPTAVVKEGIVGSSGNRKSEIIQPVPFTIDIDDMVDQSGWTPLHIAASVGNLEILKMLLTHQPTPNVDQQTSTGQTCLHFAVSKSNYEVTDYLVKTCKASARIKDSKGQYALHRAAAVGSLRMCQILIEVGKSPLNASDIYGYTPLHHALAEGHGDVAVYLVKNGADPLVQDRDGKTAYQDALNDKVRRFFKISMAKEGVDQL